MKISEDKKQSVENMRRVKKSFHSKIKYHKRMIEKYNRMIKIVDESIQQIKNYD